MTAEEALKKYATDKDLRGTRLSGVNLRGANLREADLREADLREADLREADLREADLREADLREADLLGANLSGANLLWANLSGANLSGAALFWTNLSGVNLRGANLDNCVGLTGGSIVPQVGSFYGFKKLRNGQICELIIGKNARRVGGLTGRKCRAEYVKVVSGSGVSFFDPTFKYDPGKIIRAKNFDPDPRIECSGGIHFFLTREEAEDFAY